MVAKQTDAKRFLEGIYPPLPLLSQASEFVIQLPKRSWCGQERVNNLLVDGQAAYPSHFFDDVLKELSGVGTPMGCAEKDHANRRLKNGAHIGILAARGLSQHLLRNKPAQTVANEYSWT